MSEQSLSLDAALRQLSEAEETLDAISAGAVDAVVVEGPTGPLIYTLESPDEPFRVFVEQMQEGAVTLNTDGVILYCNGFFADLLQQRLEQVRGRELREFIAPQSHAPFDSLQQAAAVDGTAHGECQLQTTVGETLPVQLAFNRLPAANVAMFGVVITNLTERARAQELEAARRTAEEANAARDQFLAIVSHELRTPLNAILGWTQLLQQRSKPASIERGLEVIERSARSQAQLIDDLLDVSRVLAGKLRLDREAVDLRLVVDTALETVQTTAEDKSVTITTWVPEQPVIVRGDADRLQQVIWNLLSNAVKFTPQNGVVHLSLTEQNGSAYLEVTDSGIGIAPEYLPRLFDFYQQIDGSTTRRSGGLGLGLAIVKQLTELHGGKVSADSQGQDRGSTFTLRLPISGTVIHNDEEQRNEERVAPVLEGIKLLLVEDEIDARDVLSQLLEHAGAQVVAVGSAKEALKKLEMVSADLLISDIGLPEMDGYSLIKRIRAAGYSGRRLPAVALTAFASREDQRQALKAGFQVHIPKPVDKNELFGAIASLSGRSAV